MATTSNMGLPIDVVSTTPGPAWATDLEQTKLLIDAHTHVSGYGVPVPTAGLNINASIPMGGFGLSSAGLMGLSNQLTTSSGSVNFLYAYGGNLYWNQGSGVPIQLTTTTGLNVSGFGGISGLAGTTGAWTYSAALTTFIGTADTNKSAAVDAGAVTIRETNVANAKGVRLKTTTGLAADYDLTMPASIPGITASSGVLMVSSAGATGVGRLGDYAFHVYQDAGHSPYVVASQGYQTLFGNKVLKDVGGGWQVNQSGVYTIPADGDWMFNVQMGGTVTTGSGGFMAPVLVVNSGDPASLTGIVALGPSVLHWVGTREDEQFAGMTWLYTNAKVGDKVKAGLIWDRVGNESSTMNCAGMMQSGLNWFSGYMVRGG